MGGRGTKSRNELEDRMHQSRLCSVIIDVNDLDVAARFWGGALGTEVAEREGEQYEFFAKKPGGLNIGLQLVPEPKTAKSRVHLDLETDDLAAEVARLEGLGARRQRFVEGWWVMEDPHGNEFCVLPREPGRIEGDANEWGEG